MVIAESKAIELLSKMKNTVKAQIERYEKEGLSVDDLKEELLAVSVRLEELGVKDV